MNVKILKEIRQFPEFTNLQPWEIFNNFISARIGKVDVPASILIEQGFIEEVKETPKPRWKVGDKVINMNNDTCTEIFSVSKSSNPRIYNNIYTSTGYFWILERDLRDPTPEELSTYFK